MYCIWCGFPLETEGEVQESLCVACQYNQERQGIEERAKRWRAPNSEEIIVEEGAIVWFPMGSEPNKYRVVEVLNSKNAVLENIGSGARSTQHISTIQIYGKVRYGSV